MPMSTTERARKAGLAAAAKLTPEQRKESSRRAYLAGAVNAVVNRAPDLTAEQVAKLRAVFAPAVAR